MLVSLFLPFRWVSVTLLSRQGSRCVHFSVCQGPLVNGLGDGVEAKDGMKGRMCDPPQTLPKNTGTETNASTRKGRERWTRMGSGLHRMDACEQHNDCKGQARNGRNESKKTNQEGANR